MMLYQIITRKVGRNDWHSYGSRMFTTREAAENCARVGYDCYPDNIFHVIEAGHAEEFDKLAIGQKRRDVTPYWERKR